jgi:hypothetical protein
VPAFEKTPLDVSGGPLHLALGPQPSRRTCVPRNSSNLRIPRNQAVGWPVSFRT